MIQSNIALTKPLPTAERERLFGLIEDLVLWENANNEEVLDKARQEIARSVARDLGVDVSGWQSCHPRIPSNPSPPVLDPFAGGGSIPLEAQRLGLRTFASDLNPVAVLINKASIEIPHNFAGLPPVHNSVSISMSKSTKMFKPSYGKKDWIGTEVLLKM